MFLKRLEVVGFKSFAEQISIDFVPGVTAVVGPNGSGKSNISDGIRWVLGEQSAKSLRGSKMEDIIFAGSDSRKPLNYAEVSLVLDNEDQHIPIDYSEVSVTRRVYRSGDSEYFINKQTCRLKDIVELFMDSGLGREAYSIIGQGKVEEILSSKAEDRRVIFEEAAGVLKYKTRKIQAEKRLNETQENLFRVEDILHELEGQVEPLKVQASMAKDYLEKREQLKVVEIALMVYEIEELHERWTKEKEQLDQLRLQYTERSEKLEEMELELGKLRQRSFEVTESINQAQDELLLASEELEKNEGKREVLKERKKNASQNKEQLIKAINERTEQKKQIEVEYRLQSERLAEARETLTKLEQKVKEKEQLLSLSEADVEQELDRLKADYIEVLNEQASIRNERRYLEEQQRQQKTKQERLLSENEGMLSTRKEMQEKQTAAVERLQVKEKQLTTISDRFRQLQRSLEQQKERYHKKESQLYEAYQLIQKLQSRADVLEEMQADFSGFFHGVKEILKARDGHLQGIVGAVAELIQVPKQFETALEVALGGASQHIVVESEADARQAIQFLKKNRIGRATFLPLPVMKPRTIPDFQLQELSKNEAFVGIASSLLTFDKRYHDVISNLLGHVIIAKDLHGANALARIVNHRFRVVTLDGDVVNPGGSMTGGSVKQSQTPLLGRKRELEDLQTKLVKLKESSYDLEQAVKLLKEQVKESETELEHVRQEGEDARTELQEAKTVLRELELEANNMEERFVRYDRDHESFLNEYERITDRLAELEISYEHALTEAEQLEAEVKRLEEERKQQRSSKETLQQELTTDKVELAQAKERFHFIREQVQRLQLNQEQNHNELTDLQDQFSLLESELTDGTTGEHTLADRIELNRKKKQDLSEKLHAARKEREGLEQEYIELEKKLKQQQGEATLMADECRQIEVRVNRLDVELDNRLTHLREEYELSFEAAKQEYELTIEAEEARTKVKLIKLAIDELGHVNLGAIEEYERVRERFDFLSEQQKDLLEAKATLHEVIAEMDEEMTKRFKDTYSHIRQHFQVVFRELFGGGEADLVLTQPDDMLNTGVEIMARPLGKKLQNLALLSGGERALTAIALLFAILKVRPVPFCVLDEVEAALDEANVSRFAHFLKDFSQATQFIVITHRKGTMEEADVLYGVTMQESGVSRLVSVRLEETKELIES
ncbi:chromosome segregation protein SMC [Halalkalibacter urbisdiaboli]|uniref:chromosome segregation protein SMC n=1 Tax=Halalkalibacter urbisdiaboli TaxID=1960589 RepID=UPI000B43BCBC|nr:chromosome segregation protein SMC [Halalkalibacter urbisdiaboli]